MQQPALKQKLLINIASHVDFVSSCIVIDKEDRLIIVSGLLEGKQSLLANLYTPNDKQKQHHFLKYTD